MKDLATNTIKERYDHLLKVLSSEQFLQMKGLGNEVPFFICPFAPEEQHDMDDLVQNLANTLHNNGIQVLQINLYDLSIELLKARGIFEQVLEDEPVLPKSELKELLQGVFDPQDHLVPAIAAKMAEAYDVMFLTGVGAVFPYIRSHTVLNNLQSTAKDRPTVMFFPGAYTHSSEKGASLELFGRLHDDRYYRAFNIYHYHS